MLMSLKAQQIMQELPIAPGFRESGAAKFFKFFIGEAWTAGTLCLRILEAPEAWQFLKNFSGHRFGQYVSKHGQAEINGARGQSLDQAGVAIGGDLGGCDPVDPGILEGGLPHFENESFIVYSAGGFAGRSAFSRTRKYSSA